jgi:hypothetical protein
MITYLYHKRHVETGLNYFGKTAKNPYEYLGSGVYWTRHLATHGANIETVQVWGFTDLNECSAFALDFSKKYNIVESSEWANLRDENGRDGGYTPSAYTKEARLKKGAKLKGRVFRKETRDKQVATRKQNYIKENHPEWGKKFSAERKQKIRDAVLNLEKITCEFCNISASPSNYARWHGKNCRNK